MDTHIREYIQAVEAFGWEGGPRFKTDITPMDNKSEKRNAAWSKSLFFASLPFLNILPDKYQYILDMFEDRMGRWGGFLYRDPARHTADNADFGFGDGVTTAFQLMVLVGRPGRKRRKDIHALYVPEVDSFGEETGDASEADIEISVNGVPTTALTIDFDRGTVEFDTAPGVGTTLTWSGPYSYWVRFDQDELPFSIDNKSGDEYVMNGSVDLIEIAPPKLVESSS